MIPRMDATTTPPRAPFCGDCHQRTTELQGKGFPGEEPVYVCTNLACTSHNVRRVRPSPENVRGIA